MNGSEPSTSPGTAAGETRRGAVGPVRWVFGSRSEGDARIDGEPDALARTRAKLTAHPWTWLRQDHGAEVVVVERPGGRAGVPGDAAVTSTPGAAMAVTTADCAPVLLWSVDGAVPVVAAVHAGWRGLYEGVIEAAAATMGSLGAGTVTGVLGPCISAANYEFSPSDLATMAMRFGPDVVSATSQGAPAFDLRAAVESATRSAGIDLQGGTDVECTAASTAWNSWRARGDTARHASVIWIEP